MSSETFITSFLHDIPSVSATVVHDIFRWDVCADASLLFSVPPKGSSPPPEAHDSLLLVLCDKATYTSSHDPTSPEFDGAIGTLELSANDLVSCGETGRWCPLLAYSRVKKRRRRRHEYGKAATHTSQVVGEVWVAFTSVQDPAADAVPRPSDLGRKAVQPGVKGATTEHGAKNIVKKGEEVSDVVRATNLPTEEFPDTLQHVDDAISVSKNPSDVDLMFYLHVWDALVPACLPGAALYLTIRILRPGEPETRVSTKPVRTHTSPQHDQSYSGGTHSRQTGATVHLPPVSSAAAPSACGGGPMIHVVWDEHLTFSVNGISACAYHNGDATVELRLSDASADLGAVPLTTTVLAISAGQPLSVFAERACCHDATFSDRITPPMSRISDAAVYNLSVSSRSRTTRENRSANGDGRHTLSPYGTQTSGPNVADGGEVQVRMASLALPRRHSVTHADDVKEFLQRKAKVSRVPKGPKYGRPGFGATIGEGFTTSRSAVGDGRFAALDLGKCEQGVIDLSAASDLFRRYATDNVNEAQDDATVADVPRVIQDERNTKLGAGENKNNAAVRNDTGKMLGVETLAALADEHFPEVSRSCVTDYDPATLAPTNEKWNKAHIETAQFSTHLPERTERYSSVTTNNFTRCDGRGHSFSSLSLAQFFSWLRKLPEDSLEAAGLLVTLETALDKTEKILSKSAEKTREVSNAIVASLESTESILQVILWSIDENAAVDRVRLGWGEEDDETAERDWNRHTRLLQRDTELLANALQAMEDDVAREAEGLSAIANAATHRSSVVANGVKAETNTELGLVAGCDTANESNENSASNGKPLSTSQPQMMQGHVGAVAISVVALHIEQEAAKLALAAEHLKEVFNCVGDIKLRQTADKFKSHRRRSRSYTSWTRHSRAVASPVVDTNRRPSNACGSQRGSPTCPNDGPFQQRRRRRSYRLLGQYVKQVTSLQMDIATFRRRATALAKKAKHSAQACVARKYPSGDLNKRGGLTGCLNDPAPRSALALVKRIRRTQETFRRSAVAVSEANNIDIDVHVVPVDNESAEMGADQMFFVSPTSSEDETSRCAPPNGADIGRESPPSGLKWDTDNNVERVHRESTSGSCHSGESDIPAAREGIPYRGRFRPSCLHRISERLELLRSAFDSAKEVGLPPAIADATAELVVQLGSSRGGLAATRGDDGIKPSAAAAICCPIDR